jgi:hypothetical protein
MVDADRRRHAMATRSALPAAPGGSRSGLDLTRRAFPGRPAPCPLLAPNERRAIPVLTHGSLTEPSD